MLCGEVRGIGQVWDKAPSARRPPRGGASYRGRRYRGGRANEPLFAAGILGVMELGRSAWIVGHKRRQLQSRATQVRSASVLSATSVWRHGVSITAPTQVVGGGVGGSAASMRRSTRLPAATENHRRRRACRASDRAASASCVEQNVVASRFQTSGRRQMPCSGSGFQVQRPTGGGGGSVVGPQHSTRTSKYGSAGRATDGAVGQVLDGGAFGFADRFGADLQAGHRRKSPSDL